MGEELEGYRKEDGGEGKRWERELEGGKRAGREEVGSWKGVEGSWMGGEES